VEILKVMQTGKGESKEDKEDKEDKKDKEDKEELGIQSFDF
jgi:hypothetical protein